MTLTRAEFDAKFIEAHSRSARFPDEHNCPRGIENGAIGRAVWGNDDCCSYCGSVNPDLLMERIEAANVVLGPSDKNYKLYLDAVEGSELFKQSFRDSDSPRGDDPMQWVWTTREVKHAKFYFQHFSEAQCRRFIELLNAKKLNIGEPGYFYRRPFFIAP